MSSSHRLARMAQNNIKDHGHDRGGRGYMKIRGELLPHLNSLRAGRGNRRIRDHRKVVSEHCASHNGAEAKPAGNAESLRHPQSNRSQRHNRPDGGSNRQRNEAGHHEQAAKHQVRRNERKRNLNRRIHRPHPPRSLCKGSGKHEDQTHRHDVDIPHAMRKKIDLAFQRCLVIQDQRRSRGDKKRNRHRHPVKVAGHDGQPHIKNKKYTERNQRPQTRAAVRRKILYIHEAPSCS